MRKYPPICAAFELNIRQVVTMHNGHSVGADDKTIRTWNVTYLAYIVPDRYLCASAGRSLTRAEWARYAPPGLAYQKLCP